MIPDLAPFESVTLLAAEYPRLDAGRPWQGGIDSSRYEAVEPPNASVTDPDELSHGYSEALRKAYTSSAYLRERNINLALLEQYGNSAWLKGNGQLEDVLRSLERQLADVRQQTETINRQRRQLQEGARPELEELERRWRRGIDQSVRAKIENEKLLGAIRQEQREQAAL